MPSVPQFRKIALSYKDVTEKPCYGTPGFYSKRKLFARILEDNQSVVLRISFEDRERRIKTDPAVFYVTDHYLKHPMMVVNLKKVSSMDLQELVHDAIEIAKS